MECSSALYPPLGTLLAKVDEATHLAAAFAAAIAAGKQAFDAGVLEPRDMAVPSTPVIGKAAFT
nr:hypothetical protein [Rhizobium leguminosarum]